MSIEDEYYRALWNLLDQTKREIKYDPTRTRRMIGEHGAVEAARRIIMKTDYSEGFTRLWTEGRLDLSIEAHLLENEQFHSLFEEEIINRCKETLTEYKYF